VLQIARRDVVVRRSEISLPRLEPGEALRGFPLGQEQSKLSKLTDGAQDRPAIQPRQAPGRLGGRARPVEGVEDGNRVEAGANAVASEEILHEKLSPIPGDQEIGASNEAAGDPTNRRRR